MNSLVKVLIGIFIVMPLSVSAHNKVVVVPLLDKVAGLQNVVTVSKKNGDFETITAALQSIRNASSSNPYLIVVGPGLYNIAQTIVMKDYVSIAGSGRETTILSGAPSGTVVSNSAIIRASSHSRISNMAIQNQGGERFLSTGILVFDKEQSIISGVAISVSDGNFSNSGVAINSLSPKQQVITDSSIKILGGGANARNVGISVVSDNLSAKNVKIQVVPITRSGTLNFGIQGEFADLKLVDVDINVLATNRAYGVASSGFSATIRNSKVIASTAAVSGTNITADSPTLFGVAHSSLSGSLAPGATNTITQGDANFVCVHSDNGLGVELEADCSFVD